MENSPSTATVTRRVEWVDTDASGHQHNSLIMRLVEAAEMQMMAEAGVLEAYFPVAPRVRHEIDFSGKLYFGQLVTVTLTLEKIGRTSMTYTFDVTGDALCDIPRRQAASGKVVVAHVPHGTEKAQPWPASIKAALRPSKNESD